MRARPARNPPASRRIRMPALRRVSRFSGLSRQVTRSPVRSMRNATRSTVPAPVRGEAHRGAGVPSAHPALTSRQRRPAVDRGAGGHAPSGRRGSAPRCGACRLRSPVDRRERQRRFLPGESRRAGRKRHDAAGGSLCRGGGGHDPAAAAAPGRRRSAPAVCAGAALPPARPASAATRLRALLPGTMTAGRISRAGSPASRFLAGGTALTGTACRADGPGAKVWRKRGARTGDGPRGKRRGVLAFRRGRCGVGREIGKGGSFARRSAVRRQKQQPRAAFRRLFVAALARDLGNRFIVHAAIRRQEAERGAAGTASAAKARRPPGAGPTAAYARFGRAAGSAVLRPLPSAGRVDRRRGRRRPRSQCSGAPGKRSASSANASGVASPPSGRTPGSRGAATPRARPNSAPASRAASVSSARANRRRDGSPRWRSRVPAR